MPIPTVLDNDAVLVVVALAGSEPFGEALLVDVRALPDAPWVRTRMPWRSGGGAAREAGRLGRPT